MNPRFKTGPMLALLICTALVVSVACNPQTPADDEAGGKQETDKTAVAESTPEPEPAPEPVTERDPNEIREVAILPVIDKSGENFASYTRQALKDYFMGKGATLVSTEEIDAAVAEARPENKVMTHSDLAKAVRSGFPKADLIVLVTIKDIERVSKKLGIEKFNKVELSGELWSGSGDQAVFSADKSAENKEKSVAGLMTKETRTMDSRKEAIRECIGLLYGDIIQAYNFASE